MSVLTRKDHYANYNFALEKLLVSSDTRETFFVRDNNYFKSSVEADFSGIDMYKRQSDVLSTDAFVDSFNLIGIAESSGQINKEGKDNSRTGVVFEENCPEVLSSSSWRNSSHMGKMNLKTEIKKTTGKHRKIATKKAFLDLIFVKITRRRRSCICKKARSSVWGLLVNIAQAFEHNSRLNVSQNESKKPQKQSSGQAHGKWDKKQTGGSVETSRGKSCASSGRIRLKVKFGNKVGQGCQMNVLPVIGNDQYCGNRTESTKSTQDIEDKIEGEVPWVSGFQCCNGDLEREIISPDASVLGACIADKKNVEVHAGKTAGSCHGMHLKELVQGLEVAVDNGCLDPGNSPDSEVINLIPDAQASGRASEDFCDVLNSSQTYVSSGDCMSLRQRKMSGKKGKRKYKLHQASSCCVPGKLRSLQITDNMGQTEKIGEGSGSSDFSFSTMTGSGSSNISCSEGSSGEPLSSSRVIDLAPRCETLKVESDTEVNLSLRLNIALESPELGTSEPLLPFTSTRRRNLPKSLKLLVRGKSKSTDPDLASRNRNACRLMVNQTKSVNKRKVKGKIDGGHVDCKVESVPKTEKYTLADFEETRSGKKISTGDTSNLDMVQSLPKEQSLPTRDAWARCDECHKWRCIPAALADSIEETKCTWVCKDNTDKDFADCSIPQEMSNAEINALLGISDASCEEDGCDIHLNYNKLGHKQSTVAQQSSWMRINSNLFLHRSRKTQTIDEIMVCQCKPPSDSQMGCGDGCLNRMLNIECVQGTCPCGELCSNQQFQKRKYAEMKWFRCGKKGYGLQLLEEVKKGEFLIEYVGEVLDVHTYEARQREYAWKGHKHFYFMSLNGSEVIDACAKGNLGRFINHSCDPNCRTEKIFRESSA